MENVEQKNKEQFQMFCFAVEDTSSGMCLFQAYSPAKQQEIAREIKGKVSKKVLIIDFAEIQRSKDMIELSDFERWIHQDAKAEVVFVLNLQLGGLWYGDVAFIERLNYMRDQLMNMGKLFVLGMSPYFRVLFSRHARDFYSFFMHSFIFMPEEMEETDSRLSVGYSALTSDTRLLVEQYQEYRERIRTYKVDEEVSEWNGLILSTIEVWCQVREYLEAGQEKWIADWVNKFYRKYIDTSWELKRENFYIVILKALSLLDEISKAIKWGNKLYRLQKQVTDNEKNLVLTVHQLSGVYYKHGDFNKAVYYNDLAYDTIRRLGKDKELEYLGIWETKALYAKYRGDYSKSLSIYQEILTLLENQEVPSAKSAVYNNIGRIYDDLEQYSQALEYYEKAEKELAKEEYRDTYNYVILLTNMSFTYRKVGDLKTAKKMILQAKKLCARTSGEQGLQMYYIYNQMAGIYGELEVRGKEEECLKKSIELAEKNLDSNQLNIATSYYNYAYFLLKYPNGCSDLKTIYGYNEKALELRKRELGENSLETTNCYLLKAYILLLGGLDKDSRICMKKVLKCYENKFGKEDRRTVKIKREMQEMFSKKRFI